MEWLHSKHNELAIASLDGNIRLVGLGQPNLAADTQNASRLMRRWPISTADSQT